MIWKRIKNLWKLSAYEPKELITDIRVSPINNQAQIIKKTNPIEDFLQQNGK